MDDILNEYEDLFSGSGCIPGVYHVQTNPGVTPVIHAHPESTCGSEGKTEAELKRMENLSGISKTDRANRFGK